MKATSFSSSQQTTVLLNLNVHCHTYTMQPRFPILRQINPFHVLPSYLTRIVILSSLLRLGHANVFFFPDFPTRILCAFLFTPDMLHAPPISSFWSDHPNNIYSGVRVMRPLDIPVSLLKEQVNKT
jgi:hypothetical protein